MTIDHNVEAPERGEEAIRPRRWPWIVAVVIALLAGVGIGAAGTGSETEPTDTTNNSAEIQDLQDQIAALETERDEALDALAALEEEPADEPEAEEANEAGTRDNPLPVGTASNVGAEYELAVTSVNLDANEEVLAANEFNEPSEVGTYVLVTIEGTFLGNETDEGNPGWDLGVVIVGNDAKQYRDSETFAVPPDPLVDSPTLEAGGTFAGNFVLSVPEDALDGASLFVEPLLSFDGERVYWALR
jgi:hypothetical protein